MASHVITAGDPDRRDLSDSRVVARLVLRRTAQNMQWAWYSALVAVPVVAVGLFRDTSSPALLAWCLAETAVILSVAVTAGWIRTDRVSITAAARVLALLHLLNGCVLGGLPLIFTDRTSMRAWLVALVVTTAFLGASCTLSVGERWTFALLAGSSCLVLAVQLWIALPEMWWMSLAAIGFAPLMTFFNRQTQATLWEAMEGRHRAARLADRLEQSEALSGSIIETAAEAIFSVDADGTVLLANHAADVLASAETELEGRAITTLLPGLALRTVRLTGEDGDSSDMPEAIMSEEMLLHADDGSLREVLVSTSTLVDKTTNATTTTLIARDITDRKHLERRLEHEATHDQLTGLLNRSALNVCAEHAARRARQAGRGFGMLFVDLDRFKHVNDGLGHAAGDLLLQTVAERIISTVGSFDDVARMGGDEFVVLTETSSTLGGAVDLAEALCDALELPYDLDGNEVFLSASIGLAWSHDAFVAPADLIKRADLAMYRAKAAGRRRVVIFDEAMQDWADERHSIEWALRRAVENDELVLHAQPLVDHDDAVVGAELLVRWNRPGVGLIPPMKFIPIAEETGLIVDIGRWVLDQACQTLDRWSKIDGLAEIGVSINISGLHLKHGLATDVTLALSDRVFDPSRLTIELTETHLMSDLSASRIVLEALRDRGVHIALDDFGTGYSSLAYFATIPATSIKIDKSFVEHITTDEQAKRLMSSIATLAASMDRSVVVEGIETEEQRDAARALGANLLQGYLFSRPVPLADFELSASAVLSARS
jgi:diguanylate cyclase (GGDEF)-like protein/PAS domain S-box-containing protein